MLLCRGGTPWPPLFGNTTLGWPQSATPTTSSLVSNHFAIGRHAWLRVTCRTLQLQLDADHLLDAIVFEVSILRCERRFWIDARNDRLERAIRRRVEIYTRYLTGSHASNIAFGNEATQV